MDFSTMSTDLGIYDESQIGWNRSAPATSLLNILVICNTLIIQHYIIIIIIAFIE